MRLFASKTPAAAAGKRLPGLLFLPGNERFQDFGASFPSDLKRDDVDASGPFPKLRPQPLAAAEAQAPASTRSGDPTCDFLKRQYSSLFSDFAELIRRPDHIDTAMDLFDFARFFARGQLAPSRRPL
jgi:hypothetical protein